MRSKGSNNNNSSKEAKSSSRAVVVVQGKAVQVGNTNSWRGLVATFIASQDVMESSRKLYTRTLTLFFLWMERSGKRLASITRQDVLEYKDFLQEQSLSSLTIGSYITAVRKFYEWAEGEKLYPNIARGIKTPRRQQAFIESLTS